MKLFVLFALLFLLTSCSGESYVSDSRCGFDCARQGFEGGACLNFDEVEGAGYSEIVDMGGCVLINAEHCGKDNSCRCFCYLT